MQTLSVSIPLDTTRFLVFNPLTVAYETYTPSHLDYLVMNKSPNDLPQNGRELVRAAEEAGGAVILYTQHDHIAWANDKQRSIAPSCEHTEHDTYETLFWSMLKAGRVGNRQAFDNPIGWLASAIATRKTSPNLDFINQYPWGKMLVSHLLFDDGTSIQARIDLTSNGLESYFTAPTAGLGVIHAARLAKQQMAFQSVLDSLEIGLGLTDGSGTIIQANASLRDLLERGDGARLGRRGTISATDPYDRIVLQQALEAAGAHEATRSPIIVPLRRKCGRPPHLLAVSPGAVPGTAFLAVSRFGEDLDALAATLQQALNLSPAEAHVTARLGAGMSVQDIAADRAISESTARTHIRNAKTTLRKSGYAANAFNDLSALVLRLAAVARTLRH